MQRKIKSLFRVDTFAVYHDTEYKEQDVDVEVCAPVKKAGENIGKFTYRMTEPIPAMACIIFPVDKATAMSYAKKDNNVVSKEE